MSELTDKLRAKGLMGWYDKAKADRRKKNGLPPLDDEACNRDAIYFRKQDGSLWTIDHYGYEPYKQVRPATGPTGEQMYTCVHCGGKWASFNEADAHLSTDEINTIAKQP